VDAVHLKNYLAKDPTHYEQQFPTTGKPMLTRLIDTHLKSDLMNNDIFISSRERK
jgi:hypothetical protein